MLIEGSRGTQRGTQDGRQRLMFNFFAYSQRTPPERSFYASLRNATHNYTLRHSSAILRNTTLLYAMPTQEYPTLTCQSYEKISAIAFLNTQILRTATFFSPWAHSLFWRTRHTTLHNWCETPFQQLCPHRVTLGMWNPLTSLCFLHVWLFLVDLLTF